MMLCTPDLRTAAGAAFESSTLRSSVAISVVALALIVASLALS